MQQLINQLEQPFSTGNGKIQHPTNLSRRAANAIKQLFNLYLSNMAVIKTLQKEVNELRKSIDISFTDPTGTDSRQLKLFD